MPQFHLDVGTPDAAHTFASLDSFTQGYIEAMFFTNASDPDDGDLDGATFAELAPESLAKIMRCERFQTANADLLERAYALGEAQACYDADRAGNDYWYTLMATGLAFGRGLGKVGEALANAARYSSVDLYRGDDGQFISDRSKRHIARRAMMRLLMMTAQWLGKTERNNENNRAMVQQEVSCCLSSLVSTLASGDTHPGTDLAELCDRALGCAARARL